MYRNDRHKWLAQRSSIRNRTDTNGDKIEFRLTFDEWYNWWQNTGHWENRGIRKGQYVMSRINDVGHYEIGNIKCVTTEENIAERKERVKPEIKRPDAKVGSNRKQRIMTPDGIFNSFKDASEFYHKEQSWTSHMIKKCPDKFYKL